MKQPKQPGTPTITFAVIGSIIVSVIVCIVLTALFAAMGGSAHSESLALLFLFGLVFGPGIIAAALLWFLLRKKK